jgi:hypothetical protein
VQYKHDENDMVIVPNHTKSMLLRNEKKNKSVSIENFFLERKNSRIISLTRQTASIISDDRPFSIASKVIQQDNIFAKTTNKFCLSPNAVKAFSNLSLRICDTTVDKQKWVIDDEGKIHNQVNINFCLKKAKMALKLAKCVDGSSAFKFAHNSFDHHLMLRINGNNVIGVKNGLVVDGALAKFFYLKSKLPHFEWSIDYYEDSYISVSKTSYASGEDIVFNFRNENPVGDSWIAIYPAGSNPSALPSPSTMWYYACGSTTGCASIESGSVTFSDDCNHGGDYWPLCGGEWQGFLINDNYAPYESVAQSEVFTVTGGDCQGVCKVATSSLSSLTHAVPVNGSIVRNIGFGSCYKPSYQVSDQLWKYVRQTFQADLWTWLGDTIYADGTDMEYKRQKYNQAKSDQYYTAYGPVAEPKM